MKKRIIKSRGKNILSKNKFYFRKSIDIIFKSWYTYSQVNDSHVDKISKSERWQRESRVVKRDRIGNFENGL